MGPIMEFLFASFGSRVGLENLSDRFEGDPLAQAKIDTVKAHGIRIVRARFRTGIRENASGLTAMVKQGEANPSFSGAEEALASKGPIDPNQHPFLAWLLSPDGIAFVYAIVNFVLTILGQGPLPPLPPLPPINS